MKRQQFSIINKCEVALYASQNSALAASSNYNVQLNNVYRWMRELKNGDYDNICMTRKKNNIVRKVPEGSSQ